MPGNLTNNTMHTPAIPSSEPPSTAPQPLKGLRVVEITGSAPVGSEITAGGKAVGTVFTQSNGQAIAYLRFDRAKGEMTAGDAKLNWQP